MGLIASDDSYTLQILINLSNIHHLLRVIYKSRFFRFVQICFKNFVCHQYTSVFSEKACKKSFSLIAKKIL
jgi:hypothetical protein